MPIVRRILLGTAGVLLSLVALEIVLQVAALFFGGDRPAAAAARDGERTVLCVGDSFTFGFGVRERSQAYPNQLERLLREIDPTWRVVNAGWSGNASAQLLDGLDRQLALQRPEHVCILVGVNDVWRDAPPAAEDGGGVELRTVKLIKLIAHWIEHGHGPAGSTTPPTEPAPIERDDQVVGAWHLGDVWFRFDAAGRVESTAGEMSWTTDGDQLHMAWPHGETIDLRWRRLEGGLELVGGPFPEPVTLQPGRPIRHAADRGFAALEAGRVEDAVAAFTAGLDGPHAPACRHGLVVAAMANDDRAAATAQLDALGAAYQRTPNALVGDALVDAARAAGDRKLAADTLCQMLHQRPTAKHLGRLVVDGAHGSPERVLATLESLTENADSSIRVGAWAGLADLHRNAGRAVDALVALLEAFRIHGDDDALQHAILARPVTYDATCRRQAVDRLALEPAERDRIRATVEAAPGLAAATSEHLARNLTTIVERVQNSGAQAVILTYPMQRPAIEAVQRDVAQRTGARFIDVQARFAVELQSRPREELFILDGHCTEVGYALMAEIVATALR